MTKLNRVLKSRDVTLLTKVHIVKAILFPVVKSMMFPVEMYECENPDHKEA